MKDNVLTLPIQRRHLMEDSETPVRSPPRREASSRSRRGSLSGIPLVLRHIDNGDVDGLHSCLTADPRLVAHRDSSSCTLLMRVMASRSSPSTVISMCNLLISFNADLESVDKDGFSVLHWAAACGAPGVLPFFSDANSWTESANLSVSGETPLHRASRFGMAENVALLLGRFPDSAFTPNHQGFIPLDVAGLVGSTENRKSKAMVRSIFAQHVPSMRALILHHDDCLKHIPRNDGSQGDIPWESPDRVSRIMSSARRIQDSLTVISSDFAMATDDQILRAHSLEYLEFLYSLHKTVERSLDSIPLTPMVQRSMARLPLDMTKTGSMSDTTYSKGTLVAARRACGAVCHGIAQVLGGKARRVFCAVRPPGHHVGHNGPIVDGCNGSCGFSILNSVAIGALEAAELYNARVAIVDLDVHHGNGTEDVVRRVKEGGRFENRIFFASVHVCDGVFYPTSGTVSDPVRNIHNFPIQPLWSSPESGRSAWLDAVRSKIAPLLTEFKPDIILLSSGFDGMGGDVGNCRHCVGRASEPGLDLTPVDFAEATSVISRVANVVCKGRIVSVLEGGYGKMQWAFMGDTSSPSDSSTKASDWSNSPGSLRGGRKRMRTSSTLTQVLNRQPLAQAVIQHVKALSSL